MLQYRHLYAAGEFGFRQRLDEAVEGDADEVAAQIWYAEIEPSPPVDSTEIVDAIRWWGDPPFPRQHPT